MQIATDVATVCKQIIDKTVSDIKGKKYLRVEGWEAIAATHGCHAGADTAERAYDSAGEHIGYTAKGYVRNSKGEIIATGEGFVGFDEKDRKGNATWKNRAEYAGRAMAQTRAISRACRGVFAHVLVLIGGIETTPAEEIPDDERYETRTQHDRSGQNTALKSEDATKLRKMGLQAIRVFLAEHEISEQFVMSLLKKGAMAEEKDENLNDLKDGVIERVNSEKYRAAILERWEAEKQVKGTIEKPVKRQWKRPSMLEPETGIVPDAALFQVGADSWRDVKINENKKLGDLSDKELKLFIGSFKPTKDPEHGYSDEDVLIDAALTLAAEETDYVATGNS